MAINLTEEQVQLFYDNGYSDEDIQAAIEEARNSGLADKDIQKNINIQIKNMGGEVPFNPFTATKEELNDEYKRQGQEKLDKRIEWEANHPLISRMQADYQPFYRSDRTAMEEQAKYGYDVPIKEALQNIAIETGQAAIPYANAARDAALTALTKGESGFLPNVLRTARMGALQSGTSDALDELSNNGTGNVLNRALKGAGFGGATGGTIQALLSGTPIVGKYTAPVTKPITDYLNRVASGAGRGFLESFAMGKEVMDRLASSPRGTEISKNADYLGSPEFLNDVAKRFKSGLDTFKNQEKQAFATARNDLIKNNQDNANINNILQNAYDKLVESGLIDGEGVTRTGARATNLNTFLEDLAGYQNKNLNMQELQNFKTDILDDIIDYRPEAGKNLNAATKKLQNIAKDARYDINSLLQNKLGAVYTEANKKMANILDVLNNTPELKNITNTADIDTLANKLKQAGTQRIQTRNELNKLEQLMKDNGVNVSDTSLADDILDYQAAKEIKERIRTGQDTQFRNIPRKALIQPATEFYYDKVVPTVRELKQVAPSIKDLIKPLALKGATNMLFGGVEYNDYK